MGGQAPQVRARCDGCHQRLPTWWRPPAACIPCAYSSPLSAHACACSMHTCCRRHAPTKSCHMRPAARDRMAEILGYLERNVQVCMWPSEAKTHCRQPCHRPLACGTCMYAWRVLRVHDGRATAASTHAAGRHAAAARRRRRRHRAPPPPTSTVVVVDVCCKLPPHRINLYRSWMSSPRGWQTRHPYDLAPARPRELSAVAP